MISGLFVPTTQVWDTSILKDIDVNSQLFKDLLVRLFENMNTFALVLNQKETGIYDYQEFVCGKVLYSINKSTSNKNPEFRTIFRKVINFGALPATTTKSVAHELITTSTFQLIHLYGASSDQSGLSYIPLPYASGTAANNIELNMDSTNINIITSKDMSAYTKTLIVIEYLKGN